MAFDPNLPQSNAPISSAELREQFIALKALIDQRTTAADVSATSAANVNSVNPVPMTFSNPPTQSDLNSVALKLNELITRLKR